MSAETSTMHELCRTMPGARGGSPPQYSTEAAAARACRPTRPPKRNMMWTPKRYCTERQHRCPSFPKQTKSGLRPKSSKQRRLAMPYSRMPPKVALGGDLASVATSAAYAWPYSQKFTKRLLRSRRRPYPQPCRVKPQHPAPFLLKNHKNKALRVRPIQVQTTHGNALLTYAPSRSARRRPGDYRPLCGMRMLKKKALATGPCLRR